AIMLRKFLQIQQINTESRAWTTLIQVVERTNVLTSRPPKNTKFRRYLLTDSEGTKVTALVYVRYYVSNVEVKEADPKYLVGDYPFSLLTKRHLIEEVKEPLPPQFSCHIEIQKYKNLFRFAETENLQNVLGIVLHVFPVKKTQGSKTRDLVIVNEEGKNSNDLNFVGRV
ncbi:RPA70-kDa subunit B, partial [Striga asiatica]